jgi:CTP synthase (UTP-ammonia lyase)
MRPAALNDSARRSCGVGYRAEMLIGVVGDRDPRNETHATLDAALAHARARWEWIPTDAVPAPDQLSARYAGLWIAPASPYKSMNGALGAIRAARERGIPLVAT